MSLLLGENTQCTSLTEAPDIRVGKQAFMLAPFGVEG